MLLAKKVLQKTFSSDDTTKSAYLDACKWVAQNIVSKKEFEVGETFWRISKVKDTEFPTVKLELYITLESEKFDESFCKACREFHSLFYINQQFNCEKCNYTAFKKQAEQKLLVIQEYRKEQLKRQEK